MNFPMTCRHIIIARHDTRKQNHHSTALSVCWLAFDQLVTGHHALRPTSLALPVSAVRTTDVASRPVGELAIAL